MLRNITFSAEETVIDQARARARKENRTLNEAFRDWLGLYADAPRIKDLQALFARLNYVDLGGPVSREEMNARR